MNITKFRNSYLIDKAYRLTLVSVLTMICERGGSVLAAGQLAKGNRDKANRIYTAAIASAVPHGARSFRGSSILRSYRPISLRARASLDW